MDLSDMQITGTNFDPVACAESAGVINIRLNVRLQKQNLFSGQFAVPLPPAVNRDHHNVKKGVVNPVNNNKRKRDETTGYQKGNGPKMKRPNPNEPGFTVDMVMVNDIPYLPAMHPTPTQLMQMADPSPVSALSKQNQVDGTGVDHALDPPSPVSSSSSSSPPRIQLVAAKKKMMLDLQRLKYCNPTKYIADIPAHKNQGTKAARRQSQGMLKTKKK